MTSTHDHALDRTQLAWSRTLLASVAVLVVAVRPPAPLSVSHLVPSGVAVAVLVGVRLLLGERATLIRLACIAAVSLDALLALVLALTALPDVLFTTPLGELR